MTSNTWPDPARPGVPLNPEKDGWHWFSGHGGDPEPFYWNGIWRGSDQFSYYSLSESTRYLGPLLTPDEAAALQKRVTELERLVKILMDSDPWDYRAADNVTVLDVWRKEARAALEGKKDD